MSIEFKIERVNVIRMFRGKAAVNMGVYEDGEMINLLWMSKSDVVKNIREHGQCEAFSTALEIYRQQRDVREGA